MKLFKRFLPRDVREIEMHGTEARVRAERELAKTVSETPYYENLGRSSRVARERNHIAERIRASIREA